MSDSADGAGSRRGLPDESPGAARDRFEQKRDERARRRYYALFENLFVMLLDWRNWSQSLRSFAQKEARYRGGLLLSVFGLFFAGITCIIVSIWLLALGSYQLLAWLLGADFLASFVLFFGFLALAVFLFLILLKTGGKLVESREEEDDLYSDDDDF